MPLDDDRLLGWIVVRRPSWGHETYHANVESLLQVWIPADCSFLGIDPPTPQQAVGSMEESSGAGMTLLGGGLSVSYELCRLEP